MCARSHARPVDPANTQLGVAKRVAGDIGYCLGLGPKSATREVAGSAFCPLTRVTPPAIVCGIDRSGVRVGGTQNPVGSDVPALFCSKCASVAKWHTQLTQN